MEIIKDFDKVEPKGMDDFKALPIGAYECVIKDARVNVKEETINKFGVVSEEVAIQMAKGVKEVSGADIGVGISGIAGPRGGTPEKPVGMVCFGIAIGNKTISMTKQFGDLGRNIVREKATEYIIELLLMLI